MWGVLPILAVSQISIVSLILRATYYWDRDYSLEYDLIDPSTEHIVSEKDFVARELIDYEFSHPFENSCVYPNLQPEDPTILDLHHHRVEYECPESKFNNFVHQFEDGSFMISEPFQSTMHLNSNDVSCYFRELTGALWPTINVYRFKGLWKKLPLEKRFRLEKDQFVIKCWEIESHTLVYHNAYSNAPFKHELKAETLTKDYSLAILQIDSTSRNAFVRHCPKTLRFMLENGYDFLHGYTKIGDNSAINTLALLSGKVFEPEIRNLSGYVDKRDFLDEDETLGNFQKLVPFLFNVMKDRGCVTFFNDDIGMTNKGLFHYQAFTGFRSVPTDYYYRPYFEYIYQNFDASYSCANGKLLIPFWLRTWKNYLLAYKNYCHFSFNHYSLFTHGDGSNLQFYDKYLYNILKELKESGVLNNAFLLINGDHGQRIHRIRGTYYGRVEERMPLAALSIPQRFKQEHPELYLNLKKNKNRFTSTFDLHETLKDVANNFIAYDGESGKLQNDGNGVYRIGTSLFQEISKDRSCREAKIPDNFCVCQVKLNKTEDIDWMEITKNAGFLMKSHIRNFITNSCLSSQNITIDLPTTTSNVCSIRPIIRSGPRTMDIWEYRKKHTIGVENLTVDILDVEFVSTITTNGKEKLESGCFENGTIKLLFRFQYNRNNTNNLMNMNVEPMIISGNCTGRILDVVCNK
ncbi:unnamed protein product [Bursaphelenchus xylophilus]|uniref:(pine wood nematode) hypothetical protein n=1 Tax=Bursaphelenchus xylophilus TaxID=6326 RepID=A0A1I7S5U4_BURXY|nr:unnamed protein product [Bursaphelenchus xylophilus]CAG9125071.1 unnamed protein product [Bursaphelenchus xylophilus]